MEAYVAGVSTRSVDDLVAALGVDSGISKSEVSRICAGLDEIVGAFRTRALDHVEFPYVYLDATYPHVRNAASQVTSMAIVVATGMGAVLADMHDEWQAGDRLYLSEGSMARLYPERDTDLIAELNSGD